MNYAFFIDVDNTLTYDGKVPERNIKAIKTARDRGHLVFLNTGRGFFFIPGFVIEQTPLDGIVAGSGMYVSYKDEVLLSEELPEKELREVMDFLISKGRKFYLEGETSVMSYGQHFDLEGFHEFYSAEDLYTRFPGRKHEKVCIPGETTEEEGKFYRARFATVTHPHYSECGKKGHDKGTGIELVLDRVGREYIPVAIGDSMNDVDSFNHARIKVAVGNASDEVKKMCDMTVSSDKDGGVGEAIELLT